MKLVIVESPTKAKTISKFLGQEYVIRASMGHVMDLPKSKLGIDIEHDFAPLYEMVKDRKDILMDLQTLAKSADGIILATDPDREGEAIAAHIKDALSKSSKFEIRNSKQSKNPKSKTPAISSLKPVTSLFSRIAFHEITKQAIEE